ncbi:hypothetical protein NLI96_g3532 [Meripilus lineatus]|uniref:DNA topoisomerase (ATP-hydrolyzing) n=1 Tax=Meripilus lineatus TaxID=2056292 RepID=A0AAD5VBE3_9APHY|nr:hypothetical protein NLI96_g3532 [Physisporinus lineatus]
MDIPSPTLTGLSDDDSWDSPVFSDDDTDLMLDFAEESYPSQSQSSNSSDDATSSAIPSDITLDFDCEMEAEISRSEDLDFDSDVDDTEPDCVSRLETFVEDFLTQLLAVSKVLNGPKATKVPKPITLQIADRSRKPKEGDMFYKDTQLFKTQSVVNKLVDDVAATLGVGRAHLNVCASPKGMFCGTALQIHLHSEEIIFGTDAEPLEFQGSLIPSAEDIAGFTVHEDLAWVLGKGYPDLATSQLVALLSSSLPPSIPFLALVDADPYGIDIMSVFKYGSASMAHEHATSTTPTLRWVGLKSSELDRPWALVPITRHDEKKTMRMLTQRALPEEWR